VAIIEIDPRDVGAIRKEKAFYRTEVIRSMPDAPDGRGLWTLLGASAELSDIRPDEAMLTEHTFGNRVPEHVDHDGNDYLELKYGATDHEYLPTSWGGLSGAALWKCAIASDGSRAVPILSGLAFFQVDEAHKIGRLRCHGPKTLRRAIDIVRRLPLEDP
jgi:hypothetical protein